MKNFSLRATPAARKLAKELNIDLSLVRGTGASGRIHKDDVSSFKFDTTIRISPLARKMAEIHNIPLDNIKGSGVNSKIMKSDILPLIKRVETVDKKVAQSSAPVETKANTIENENSNQYGKIEHVPMSMMRKVISKRMKDSYLTAPTLTLNYDVDMTEAIALRKQLIEPIMNETGKKITITEIISLAVIKTLMKHKFINASLSPDAQMIEFHDYVNLAIAVGFDEGLLVPVVFNAEKKSLKELVVSMKEITKQALEMKLAPEQLQGSTFTISNLGMYGVSSFGPIINQPNSAILGVSSTIEKPVVLDGQVVIRPIMSLGLTIDHRLIDGLAGAKFMKDLKELLENPITMLI